MVIITNIQAQEALGALHELARKEMAVGPALKIRKMLVGISAHMKDVEDVRLERLRLAAKKDENDQIMTGDRREALFESPESAMDFATFYQELMSAEQEYSYTLSVADLGDIRVKPEVLVALGPLLETEGT